MMYKNVLVVDDHYAWINKIIHYFRKELGIEPDTTEEIDEAIDMAKKKKYELCVLDGLYGEWVNLRESLLEINPKSRIILLTKSEEYVEEATSKGIEAYLKPNGIEDLIDSLK